MKTISASSNTEQFIQDLNDNFAEAANGSGGGGSSSSIERTITMQMQGGAIEAGYTKGKIAASSNMFKNYCHTVLMLNIEGCSVKSVSIENGETLTIYYYGADGSYTSSVSSVANIPASACYVKFQVNKSSAYTSMRTLSVTVEGNPRLVKNDVPTRVTPKFISFETTMPTRIETTTSNTSDIGSYIGDNTRYWDNGYVMLPVNYSRDGEPVPLVVFVHGTGGQTFTSDPSALYIDLMKFVVNNGYALADCSGVTNANSSVGNAFAAPSYTAAITNLVKFLTSNYNIKDDGIYIYCKSSGGFVCHLLALTQNIKIRAVASLAPALSPMVSMAHHSETYTATANMEAAQIGVSGTFVGNNNFSSEEKAIVLNNVHLWRQIDPFFMGTDLTDEQVATIVDACYSAGGTGYHLNIVYCSNSATSEVKAKFEASRTIMNAAKRWIPCPTKIWIASDDDKVFHDNSKMFVEMAQRAGCPCYLRSLPSSTGKHHAVDGVQSGNNNTPTEISSTIRTDYTTRYQGGTYRDTYPNQGKFPIAYAEMIDWFNRW